MLRLHTYDPKIILARPGVVRIGCGDSVRDVVTADLLRRLLELQRLRCVTYWEPPTWDAASMNIGPPTYGAAEPGSVDVFVRTATLRYPPETDPLAVRLAMLRRHYRSASTLSAADVGSAAETLETQRKQVAAWAKEPSKALSAAHLSATIEALENDLDTGSALTVLEDLASDDSVAPGSKFETFAHLDRVFALDLVRDVGKI